MTHTLADILEELRRRLKTDDVEPRIEPEAVEQIKRQTVVVMPAGGKGERIRSMTSEQCINKVMISVDGRESMIERAIREYSTFGVRRFVVLTGYLAEKVEQHLGDGSKWGVDIQYSRDPAGRKLGSAGAILNALDNGTLDDRMTAIVHNPDDMIIGMSRPYVDVFLEGHIRGVRRGCICTFIVVPETPYQYSGLLIERSLVRDVVKYPLIPIPTHTGITIFSPAVYDYFRRLVSREIESSFESVVAPCLVKEERVYSLVIPSNTWFPVNDLKGMEAARAALCTQRQGLISVVSF